MGNPSREMFQNKIWFVWISLWNDCILQYKGKCDRILKVTSMTLKVRSHLSLLCIISYCHSNMNLHDLEFHMRVYHADFSCPSWSYDFAVLNNRKAAWFESDIFFIKMVLTMSNGPFSCCWNFVNVTVPLDCNVLIHDSSLCFLH